MPNDVFGSLDPRGPVAAEMADVWWFMFGLGLVVFILFAVLLVSGLFRDKGSDRGMGSSSHRWIVGGGVVLPVVVVTVVFGVTLAAMRILPVGGSGDAVVVDVIGHQWWWEVHYPDHDVTTANEIHMPVGRPVELRLSSADVIHSFWVPSLGGKLDLLPDRVNTMEFSADEPGEYRGVCAEFCGTQHAKMGFLAVAESPAEFEAWLATQSQQAAEPVGEVAARGREVFSEVGCADCHTIEGTDAVGTTGPDLTHLATRETLAAATLPNTPEHLADWVGDPQEIKEGVNMPDLPIGEEDMAALLAYLEGLE